MSKSNRVVSVAMMWVESISKLGWRFTGAVVSVFPSVIVPVVDCGSGVVVARMVLGDHLAVCWRAISINLAWSLTGTEREFSLVV